MNEVENLFKEVDKWVSNKKDAIKFIAYLWAKFDISTQDIIKEWFKQKSLLERSKKR